jgi:hypothetical protein
LDRYELHTIYAEGESKAQARVEDSYVSAKSGQDTDAVSGNRRIAGKESPNYDQGDSDTRNPSEIDVG